MNIGERIREKRIEKGWSLRDLSEKLGYSNHSTLQRIEKGQVDLSQSRIVQFAKVLNTTVPFLMGWEEMQKNNDVISDIIVRMRSDKDFLSVVEKLKDLDDEQLSSVENMLSAFLK